MKRRLAEGITRLLGDLLVSEHCGHVWIRLTSVSLEKLLISGDSIPWNVRGCRLCGMLMNDEEEIFPHDYTNVANNNNNDLKEYWIALSRFKDEQEL